MLHKFLLFFLLTFGISWVHAIEIPYNKIKEKIGESSLSILIWDVYDIKLYAEKKPFSNARVFEISIAYLTDISKKDITDYSIQEMRRIGFKDEVTLAAWHSQMKKIFPNIKNGMTLSAVFNPNGKAPKTEFYKNGRWIGQVIGNEFIDAFSGIWLSTKTSKPTIRKELLGYSS